MRKIFKTNIRIMVYSLQISVTGIWAGGFINIIFDPCALDMLAWSRTARAKNAMSDVARHHRKHRKHRIIIIAYHQVEWKHFYLHTNLYIVAYANSIWMNCTWTQHWVVMKWKCNLERVVIYISIILICRFITP